MLSLDEVIDSPLQISADKKQKTSLLPLVKISRFQIVSGFMNASSYNQNLTQEPLFDTLFLIQTRLGLITFLPSGDVYANCTTEIPGWQNYSLPALMSAEKEIKPSCPCATVSLSLKEPHIAPKQIKSGNGHIKDQFQVHILSTEAISNSSVRCVKDFKQDDARLCSAHAGIASKDTGSNKSSTVNTRDNELVREHSYPQIFCDDSVALKKTEQSIKSSKLHNSILPDSIELCFQAVSRLFLACSTSNFTEKLVLDCMYRHSCLSLSSLKDVCKSPWPSQACDEPLTSFSAKCEQTLFPGASVASKHLVHCVITVENRSTSSMNSHLGDSKVASTSLHFDSSNLISTTISNPILSHESRNHQERNSKDRLYDNHVENFLPTQKDNTYIGRKDDIEISVDSRKLIVTPPCTFVLTQAKYFGYFAKRLGQYDLIIVDPPWHNKSARRGSRYNMMDEDAIMDIPIPLLASKACILGIWITNNPKCFSFVKV